MNRILIKNLANLIVGIRIIFIFFSIFFLNRTDSPSVLTGLFFLFLLTNMDWLDGYVARKLNSCSSLGELLDTLGDRITENLFLVYFTYKGLVPLIVSIMFIFRSFLSDFIRTLNLNYGFGTFDINTSKIGYFIISSKFSKTFYLMIKMLLFFLAGIALYMSSEGSYIKISINDLKIFIKDFSYFVLFINLLRFAILIYDSRNNLKRAFCNLNEKN